MLISEEKCLDLTVYHYSEDQYWGEGGGKVLCSVAFCSPQGAGANLGSESRPAGTRGLRSGPQEWVQGSPDLSGPAPRSSHWGTSSEGGPLPPKRAVPVGTRHRPGPVWECRPVGDQLSLLPSPFSPSSALMRRPHPSVILTRKVTSGWQQRC